MPLRLPVVAAVVAEGPNDMAFNKAVQAVGPSDKTALWLIAVTEMHATKDAVAQQRLVGLMGA